MDIGAKLEQVIAILNVKASSPQQIDQEYQELLKLKGNAYSAHSLSPPVASVIPPAGATGQGIGGYAGYHFG